MNHINGWNFCDKNNCQSGQETAVILTLFMIFHSFITNKNSPYISTCFGNHKHSNHWNLVCKKHHWNVKSKAQYNGKPHVFEFCIMVFAGTFVKKNNDQKAKQRKRNISVNSPGERRSSTEPLILWEKTENDPQCG